MRTRRRRPFRLNDHATRSPSEWVTSFALQQLPFCARRILPQTPASQYVPSRSRGFRMSRRQLLLLVSEYRRGARQPSVAHGCRRSRVARLLGRLQTIWTNPRRWLPPDYQLAQPFWQWAEPPNQLPGLVL